ncbi:ROK family protein [Luteimicrobium subarcticum]|uniref:Glucokinase n=1 Tax=Luteimicrobium subarcticum TaxID=620910 RepID=A0A2M8WV27_9MICO|nr:ROK family protein [Luteimicrobium subarcticum]PJI94764.1 glucokinase [Luteimicrobium subarcticum]
MSTPAARPTTSPTVLALDVGGTDIKAAVVGEHGMVVRTTVPTRTADREPLDSVLLAAHRLWESVPAGYHVTGLGIATPGIVDDEDGVVRGAENLGWREVPLRSLLEEELGVPVGIGHDVRAGGLAEWRLGAGRGAGDHAFVAVGTGIAASVVLHGAVYAGGGWAGEVGHGGRTTGEPCACGGRGCIETYASAAGIARRYTARTGVHVPGAREVLERAQAGDVVAADVWAHGVDGLGELVAGLVRTLGLRLVVVGGGLVRAGDALLDPLDAAVRRYLTVHPVPELRPAGLGSDAGTYGAALLGWGASGRGTLTDLVVPV